MKTLVTGATGLIGSHLMPLLLGEEGHDLMLLSRRPAHGLPRGPSAVRALAADLNDVSSYTPQVREFGPQAVVHLSWEGIPDFGRDTCMRNLVSSVRFIDFLCGLETCKKIIITGSCFEYGNRTGICRETDPIVPVSFFTWAKTSLESYASIQCAEKKISMIWYRLFYVYGPRQRAGSLIPALLKTFRAKESPTIKTPFNANDFVYAGDVGEGIRRALGRPMDSGIYNLGSGQATRVVDVCELIEKAVTGGQACSDRLRSAEGTPPPKIFWADMEKTSRALGWKPEMPLSVGIRRMVEAGGAES